jgi:hypothetical protein
MAGFLDGFKPNQSALGNIVRNLSKISKFGMEYDDMVVRNSQALGKTESSFFNQQGTGFTQDDAFFWTLSHQDTRVRKYIAYFDKDYIEKRNFLRKFSLNGEIEFILDTITDEAISYDDRNFFAKPSFLNLTDLKDSVKDKISDHYNRIYNIFGFQNTVLAWQLFKQFLIDGFLAFEIIYGNNGKEIVGFKEIDATSLQPAVEKVGDNEYKQFWIQYPKNPQMTRKLMNEQIIYLSYAKGNSVSRVSYTERLIRSYNILRIMENSRVIWNVMNASFRLKLIIPTGTQSQQKSMQTLGQIMSIHKEEYAINDTSGELTINGRPKVQFYKNFLFPDANGTTPTVESFNPQGPDFNIMDSVLYFFNKLKMDSKIPYARFASRGTGPVNYQTGLESLERDEIRFEKFLRRLRATFQEIMIKPLYIQMCLDSPELAKDRSFKSNLSLNFFRDSQFEKMVELTNYKKRTEFINGMLEFKSKVGEEEVSYFDNDFLINRYLGMNPDMLRLNEKYKKKEEKEGKVATTPEGGAEAPEGGAAAPASAAAPEAGTAPEGGEGEAVAI